MLMNKNKKNNESKKTLETDLTKAYLIFGFYGLFLFDMISFI